RNALEAISQGASTVVNIVAEILANLVVFVAILAFVDSAIWSFFDLVGWNVTFQQLLGYLFFPLAFIMGSSDAPDWDRRINETMVVAQLMGTKTVVNEFIAYKDMSAYVEQGLISGRAQMMATFTLCGFSNFGSIGMQLGLIGSLCPEKRPVVAEIILRSLVSGAVACFMTACVAGSVSHITFKRYVQIQITVNQSPENHASMIPVPNKSVDFKNKGVMLI
uniref:Concentrative nucleoside transporter C-terminal domain-containing protein n=1 Tax=Romanomermis culicivorax TaxID=13658 RepID=A0A915L7G6_ROMCU